MVKTVLRGDGIGRDDRRRVAGIDAVGRPPVMRQQRCEVACFERGQPLEYVLEIGPRIVTIELGRLDQAEHRGGALAGLLGAHKKPAKTPESTINRVRRYWEDLVVARIFVHTLELPCMS